jgi:DNA-binding transcriptional regulator GbsR (MarR family)
MELTNSAQRFILHWGEMGTRWGINRTVAQIHALLFLSEQPLTAEEIATTLSVARSNVSTSLRELQGWGIVRVESVMGDRRDYFTTLDDVWDMFFKILVERKKREIDPTLSVVRDCVMTAQTGKNRDTYAEARMSEILEFFERSSAAFDDMQKIPVSVLAKTLQMGQSVFSFANKTKRAKRGAKK